MKTHEENEQFAIDCYFHQLSIGRNFICDLSWQNIVYCVGYVFSSVCAIYGAATDNSFLTNQRILLGILIAAQTIIGFVGYFLAGQILSNEAICESHVDYCVQNATNSILDKPSLLKLYFNNAIPNVDKTSDLLWRLRKEYSWTTFSKYALLLVFLFTLLDEITACYALSINSNNPVYTHIYLVYPWACATYQSACLNNFSFSLMNNCLYYYKRNFFKSAFFNDERWSQIVLRLSHNQRFKKQQFVVQKVTTPVSRQGIVSRVKSLLFNDTTSYQPDSTLNVELLSANSSSSVTTVEQHTIIKTVKTSVAYQLDNEPLLSIRHGQHHLSHDHAISAGASHHNNSNLNDEEEEEEGGKLLIDKLGVDLFKLQHAFQIFNHTIGNSFSILAVMSLILFVYSLFVIVQVAHIFTTKNYSESSPSLSLIYVVQICTVNFVLVLRFLWNHNTFGQGLSEFLTPVKLLCADSQREKLEQLQQSIPDLKLQILVFGFAVTPGVVVSLLATAVAAVGTQIYVLLLNYSS